MPRRRLDDGARASCESGTLATPVVADSRIRTVPFERDNVVTVWGTRGVSTIVVLGEDEKIETVALGDSLAWQAVPDQSKRYLFIKPLEKGAVTNMTVVTRKRIYNFILRADAQSARRVVFKMRFTYPEDEADARLMEKARELASFPNCEARSARAFAISTTPTRVASPSNRKMSSTMG